MKTRTKLVAAIAGLAIVGGIAAAAAKGSDGKRSHFWRGGHGAGMFEQVDADGDGRVTRAELDAYLDGILAANDADGNGSVSLPEFEAIAVELARPMLAKRFERLDDDGNGEISESEIAGRIDRLMDRADRNDDGAVELKEIKRGRHGKGHRHGHHHHDKDDDD